jgi:hypothetical protein
MIARQRCDLTISDFFAILQWLFAVCGRGVKGGDVAKSRSLELTSKVDPLSLTTDSGLEYPSPLAGSPHPDDIVGTIYSHDIESIVYSGRGEPGMPRPD